MAGFPEFVGPMHTIRRGTDVGILVDGNHALDCFLGPVRAPVRLRQQQVQSGSSGGARTRRRRMVSA